MQLICISRGTYAGGKELAEKLASKLGYACLSREEVTDAASMAGIPVGRLEMSIVRHRPLNEQLAVDKERYAAFITARLAEGALEGGLIYHGRTGHLVLPTVENVLRIRAIQDTETRVNRTMVRLGLSREKARKYITEVDEDRQRWARMVYNVDWEDPSHYDMVVNFDHMSVDNAAAALVPLAALPEFQQTPATRRELKNLLRAAQCRLAIGDDPRTRRVDVKVKAEGSKITVTYPPRHQSAAAPIPEILTSVRDVSEVTVTMAATNILWVQERYDADGTTLPELLEIAEKWNAAVTLVRLIATEEDEPASEVAEGIQAADTAPAPVSTEEDGGILDDEEQEEEQAAGGDGGMDATMDLLIRHGRAGGRSTVMGSPQALIRSLDRTVQVSLVVIGDVFLSRSDSLRKRQTRELAAYVAESLRVPVIGTEELKEQYLFGASQWLKLIGLLAVTGLMFGLVMTHQERAIGLITGEGVHHKIVAVVLIVLFVPTFAYVWGQSASYLLRLAKFE